MSCQAGLSPKRTFNGLLHLWKMWMEFIWSFNTSVWHVFLLFVRNTDWNHVFCCFLFFCSHAHMVVYPALKAGDVASWLNYSWKTKQQDHLNNASNFHKCSSAFLFRIEARSYDWLALWINYGPKDGMSRCIFRSTGSKNRRWLNPIKRRAT